MLAIHDSILQDECNCMVAIPPCRYNDHDVCLSSSLTAEKNTANKLADRKARAPDDLFNWA